MTYSSSTGPSPRERTAADPPPTPDFSVFWGSYPRADEWPLLDRVFRDQVERWAADRWEEDLEAGDDMVTADPYAYFDDECRRIRAAWCRGEI